MWFRLAFNELGDNVLIGRLHGGFEMGLEKSGMERIESEMARANPRNLSHQAAIQGFQSKSRAPCGRKKNPQYVYSALTGAND